MAAAVNMIVLDAGDNVGVALRDIAAGETALDASVMASRPRRRSRRATRLHLRRSLQGEKIMRFGVPVGIARARQSTPGISSTCTTCAASTSTTTTTTMSSASATPPTGHATMRGYPRQDGRKGIRNFVVVAYLVECAHHVARHIAQPYQREARSSSAFPAATPATMRTG